MDHRVYITADPTRLRYLGEIVDVVHAFDPATGRESAVCAVLVCCYCGDSSCPHFDSGYPWCRPCGEHHRGPECAIDEQGRALSPQGVPWDEAP